VCKNHTKTLPEVPDVREGAWWSHHKQARRGDPPGRPYFSDLTQAQVWWGDISCASDHSSPARTGP